MTHMVAWIPGMEPLERAVVAIGVFDGVHAGHQRLVEDAVALAADLRTACMAVTFDRDPETVVCPHAAAPQLTTLPDKLELLAGLGLDAVLVVPFTAEIAALAPAAFLRDVLMAACPLAAVTVGSDFRFGSGARGDVALLRAFGGVHGFPVVAHELLRAEGAPVTSTRIRRLIAAGDVTTAARLLTRPHRLHGIVVHGRGEGAAMGVPTANVTLDAGLAVPADGVYAGLATVAGERYAAGISLGVPPTFPEATDGVEAHLLGYAGPDLAGERITLEPIERLRDQRRFDDRAALVAAIRDDLARCERLVEPFLRR